MTTFLSELAVEDVLALDDLACYDSPYDILPDPKPCSWIRCFFEGLWCGFSGSC